MPENMHALHRIARPTMPTLIVVAVVATVFFAGGFCTGRFIRSDRSEDRFREFVSTGIELGFITVDERKLEEAVIAGTEGEDSDAAEREKGDNP